MLVDESTFEALLERALSSAPEDSLGFFSPRSLSWRINREAVLHVGGIRAALMQMAHPLVAQGVADHSDYEADALGRFIRTFDAVYAILFGARDAALHAARTVYRVHTHVRGELPEDVGRFPAGTPYHAIDDTLLRWVWATLTDSAVDGYERFYGRLSAMDRLTYYRESMTFAQLFGVDPARLPPDFQSFRRWMDRVVASDTLGVGAAGRAICASLLRGPGHFRPLAPLLQGLAAATLPPRLARDFGLAPTRLHRVGLRALTAVLRRVLPRLPDSLRIVPQAQAAEAALVGRPVRGLQLQSRIMDRLRT